MVNITEPLSNSNLKLLFYSPYNLLKAYEQSSQGSPSQSLVFFSHSPNYARQSLPFYTIFIP